MAHDRDDGSPPPPPSPSSSGSAPGGVVASTTGGGVDGGSPFAAAAVAGGGGGSAAAVGARGSGGATTTTGAVATGIVGAGGSGRYGSPTSARGLAGLGGGLVVAGVGPTATATPAAAAGTTTAAGAVPFALGRADAGRTSSSSGGFAARVDDGVVGSGGEGGAGEAASRSRDPTTGGGRTASVATPAAAKTTTFGPPAATATAVAAAVRAPFRLSVVSEVDSDEDEDDDENEEEEEEEEETSSPPPPSRPSKTRFAVPDRLPSLSEDGDGDGEEEDDDDAATVEKKEASLLVPPPRPSKARFAVPDRLPSLSEDVPVVEGDDFEQEQEQEEEGEDPLSALGRFRPSRLSSLGEDAPTLFDEVGDEDDEESNLGGGGGTPRKSSLPPPAGTRNGNLRCGRGTGGRGRRPRRRRASNFFESVAASIFGGNDDASDAAADGRRKRGSNRASVFLQSIFGRRPSEPPPPSPEKKVPSRGWEVLRKKMKSRSLFIRRFSASELEENDEDEDVERDGAYDGNGGGTSSSNPGFRGFVWMRFFPRRKNKKKKKKSDDADDMPYDFTLTECLSAILLYLLLGAVSYSFLLEHWTVVDSLYFAVVTFTTVGYGDVCPLTSAGKAFAAAYAWVGIAFLGVALGVLGSRVVEAQVEAVERAEREASRYFLSAKGGEGEDEEGTDEEIKEIVARMSTMSGTSTLGEEATPLLLDASAARLSMTLATATTSPHSRAAAVNESKLRSALRAVLRFLNTYLPVLLPLFVASILMARAEGWTWDESLYYFFVTSSTVGYGDYAPSRTIVKCFAILYIPVSVGVAGHLLGNVANHVVERRQLVNQRRMWHRDWKMEDLTKMDTTGSGTVSEQQYVEHMLLAMRKVEPELLEELRTQFRELDVTKSGQLSRETLKVMAERRIMNVKNKLELAEYKRKITTRTTNEQ